MNKQLRDFYDSLPYDKRGEFVSIVLNLIMAPGPATALALKDSPLTTVFVAGRFYYSSVYGVLEMPASTPLGDAHFLTFVKADKSALILGANDLELHNFIPLKEKGSPWEIFSLKVKQKIKKAL